MIELDPKLTRRAPWSFAITLVVLGLALLVGLVLTTACTTQDRIAIAKIGRNMAQTMCIAEPYIDAATGTTAIHIHLVMQPKGIAVVTSTLSQGGTTP